MGQRDRDRPGDGDPPEIKDQAQKHGEVDAGKEDLFEGRPARPAPLSAGELNQIGYDYDTAIEKCRKKAEKEDADNDVGDEAMSLMVKKAKREAEYQKKKKEEKERAKK